jgi:hypothetical protein
MVRMSFSVVENKPPRTVNYSATIAGEQHTFVVEEHWVFGAWEPVVVTDDKGTKALVQYHTRQGVWHFVSPTYGTFWWKA